MKLSISIPEDDVEALDAYVRDEGLPSRSAAVQRAVRTLVHPTMEDDYTAAYDEWVASGEAGVWEHTVSDGLG